MDSPIEIVRLILLAVATYSLVTIWTRRFHLAHRAGHTIENNGATERHTFSLSLHHGSPHGCPDCAHGDMRPLFSK